MEPFKFSIDFNVNIKLQDDTKQLLEKLSSFIPAAPAATADTDYPAAPADNELSINDVRKLLAEKVNEHRAEIKDKLTELGAPSVTKLNKSKYQELFDFLNTL